MFTWIQIHDIAFRLVNEKHLANALLLDRLQGYITTTPASSFYEISIAPSDANTLAAIADTSKELTWIRTRPCWGTMTTASFRITDGASFASFHFQQKKILFWIHPETEKDSEFLGRTFLLLPILEALRAHGYLYMHCAAVENQNDGVLILGEGGAGKSTLTAALIQSGWKVISDDNVLLKLDRDGIVRAYSFEQELSLHPDGWAEMKNWAYLTKERHKTRISLSRIQELTAPFTIPRKTVWLSSSNASEKQTRAGYFLSLAQENPMIATRPELANIAFATLGGLLSQATSSQFCPRDGLPLHLPRLAQRFQTHLKNL